MKEVYLVDCGVLLPESDREFEAYSNVYDKKHGYYDEYQCYVKGKEEAIKEAKDYVQSSMTDGGKVYAVVSCTTIPADTDPSDAMVESETYDLDDVVYSISGSKEGIVENFIRVEQKLEQA